MGITDQLKNQHLLWRAGFGPMAEDLSLLSSVSQKSLYQTILKASSKEPQSIRVADSNLQAMMMGFTDAGKTQKKDLTEDEKKALRKQSYKAIRDLNIAWLGEMVNSDMQLNEKMSLFWHGHFASRNENIFYQQLLLDTIRKNALGNFGDLLRQVSKSATMINFLNNNQNNKNHPNENFAREVMELFTMGRGHYSEDDVKEAARAFTGWGANQQGDFEFRKKQHDDGVKTVLGKTGNFDGDDLLNILLEKKETAHFISRKLYKFFVNDAVDEQRAAWLGDRFYQSQYDIKSLMSDIFTSQWFYDPKNIGARIKSPIELIVGIRRMLPMKIQNEDAQLVIESLLGQVLFNPPNVAGWPGGTNWIDSSSLMFRMRIPQIIFQSDELELKPKSDDDMMMGMRESLPTAAPIKGFGKMKNAQMIDAEIFWNDYIKKYDAVPREKLMAEISRTILQTREGVNPDVLKKYVDANSRDYFIKTTTIQLMSTPEYQLC